MFRHRKTASESIDLGIDFRPWLEYYWRAGVDNEVDDVVRPSNANGFEYKCVVAGRTHTKEPIWKKTVGQQQDDGGARWECQKVSSAGQDRIATPNVTAESGITVGSGNVQGDVLRSTISSGIVDSRYQVSFEVSTEDGYTYEEKIEVYIYGP